MEQVNCHIHTAYSGHGSGSVDQMVDAARKAGITTLAITEHYPLPVELDPQAESALVLDALPQYVIDVLSAQQRSDDIEVIRGAEFDWLGSEDSRNLADESFEPFAYSLLSVHFIDGWGFDNPAHRDRWETIGVDAAWRRYIELWIEAATSSWPCTAMAHPDLIKKFGFLPHFDLMQSYNEMVEALASTDRIIELNTAGAFCSCAEMYPAPELLRLFCRAGIPCSVGTDAHQPDNITRGLKDAYRMMYEAGYRFITVPTATGDRRLIPFD